MDSPRYDVTRGKKKYEALSWNPNFASKCGVKKGFPNVLKKNLTV